MTEHEWLASSDPQAMLKHLQTGAIAFRHRPGGFPASYHAPLLVATDRKLRLFACACVRQIWHLLDDKRSRHAVEMAERYADGFATQQELAAAWDAAWYAARDAAWYAASSQQSILLRDIVGNPWRPWCVAERKYNRTLREYQIFDLDWLTPDVKSLAQAAYEERGENGHLDPDRLLILADALEEAGCDCEEILRHLRSKDGEPSGCPRCEFTGRLVVPELPRGWQYCPFCADKPNGPHVRGCWVVDLLLGKE